MKPAEVMGEGVSASDSGSSAVSGELTADEGEGEGVAGEMVAGAPGGAITVCWCDIAAWVSFLCRGLCMGQLNQTSR